MPSAERWRVQEKWKKEKRKKKKKKHRNRRWWKMCKEIIISLFMMRMKKGEKEKESRERARRPKARQTLGKFRKLFFLLILVQSWLSVSAAAEGPQKRTDEVMRVQQEVQIKESKWAEATPKWWKHPIR